MTTQNLTGKQGSFEDRMTHKIQSSPATLTVKQMEAIESRIRHEGVTRRCALAILTQSGRHTLESVAADRDTAEAMAAVFVRLKGERELYADLGKLIGQAEAWLMFALAERTDCNALITAAKSEIKAA